MKLPPLLTSLLQAHTIPMLSGSKRLLTLLLVPYLFPIAAVQSNIGTPEDTDATVSTGTKKTKGKKGKPGVKAKTKLSKTEVFHNFVHFVYFETICERDEFQKKVEETLSENKKEETLSEISNNLFVTTC